MAASASFFPEASSVTHDDHQSKVIIESVKELAQSPVFNSNTPTNYIFNSDSTPDGTAGESSKPEDTIRVVDFALLTSIDPVQRSTTIQELGKACQEWGVFMVTNHGVSEELMKRMISACEEFFDLPEEEKQVQEGVQYGPRSIKCRRDYLMAILHPEFTSPSKPIGFSETAKEFSQTFREIIRILLKGISSSLGLEENYIDNALNLENCHQFLASNFYPPCQEPQLGIGLPPHTDTNLLTIIIQNGIGGFQVKHKEKWFDINFIPNSLTVITADQIEILSNGTYKSLAHRAVLHSRYSRISVVTGIGPASDVVVRPAPKLVEGENKVPIAYTAMKYKDYFEGVYSRKLKRDPTKICTPDN